MTRATFAGKKLTVFATQRRDRWWLASGITLVVFLSFIVYGTWVMFQDHNYFVGNYLSPFYSPPLFGPRGLFGEFPRWWPAFVPKSPALLILIFPLGFRLTCYYYRGAYYKAFWADPAGCAVSEPRHSYRGESALPLIVMNVHRYFLYVAIIYVGIFVKETWSACWFEAPSGATRFGIGVGTLIVGINTVLLAGYTLGCHSLRHLVGGALDQLSRAPARKRAYDCVSCLNRHHPRWAWASLFWVVWSDIYIRAVASGAWSDYRLL